MKLLAASVVRLCVLLGVLSLGGCSWLFVTEAPPQHERLAYFDCTSSKAAPIVDTLFAATYGIEAGLMASGDLALSGSDSHGEAAASAAIALGVAVVDAASAVYGFRKTSECARAKDELSLRLQEQGGLAPHLGMPAANGCRADVECKGDRLCVAGQCVTPAAPPSAPPPSAPPPTSPPAAPAAPAAPAVVPAPP